MSVNIFDLLSQKAIAEKYAAGPNQAMAAVGGVYAQCKKELPEQEFHRILEVSGPRVSWNLHPS